METQSRWWLKLRCGLMFGVAAVVGCSSSGELQSGDTAPARGLLTVYSGRSENLIGPLLERFRQASGIDVAVRYGGTAELVATLLEEGDATPAGVFIGQDAGALGALSAAGLFRPLPDTLLERVPAVFRSPQDDWVALSGRARVVAYNSALVTPQQLPQNLEQATRSEYKGRFGLAPRNASFQAHMAVFNVLHGAEATVQLFHDLMQNEPRLYDNNVAIVGAVATGEIDWGLTNHYYLWRALAEAPEATIANFYMPEGDASGFVNLAGAGVLEDSPGAISLLEHMLSIEGQRYFAEETFEYPLVPGVSAAVDLPSLAQLRTPALDFSAVSEALEATIVLIRESGLIP